MFEKFYAGSQVFRDNIRFLSQARLSTVLTQLINDSEREKQIMAGFQDDETRLEADVAAETALVTQVQTTTQANTAQIKALSDEVVAAKAQGLDTTKMEAVLTAFEANNTALAAAVPAPPSGTPPTSDPVPSDPPSGQAS